MDTTELLTRATHATAHIPDTHIIGDNNDVLTVSAPTTHRTQTETALKPYPTLPLVNLHTRACYALFPLRPETDDPYHRTVYLRVTGNNVPDQWNPGGKHEVLITPGHTTEADIPTLLSVTVFGTPDRAHDITVLHIV